MDLRSAIESVGTDSPEPIKFDDSTNLQFNWQIYAELQTKLPSGLPIPTKSAEITLHLVNPINFYQVHRAVNLWQMLWRTSQKDQMTSYMSLIVLYVRTWHNVYVHDMYRKLIIKYSLAVYRVSRAASFTDKNATSSCLTSVWLLRCSRSSGELADVHSRGFRYNAPILTSERNVSRMFYDHFESGDEMVNTTG